MTLGHPPTGGSRHPRRTAPSGAAQPNPPLDQAPSPFGDHRPYQRCPDSSTPISERSGRGALLHLAVIGAARPGAFAPAAPVRQGMVRCMPVPYVDPNKKRGSLYKSFVRFGRSATNQFAVVSA